MTLRVNRMLCVTSIHNVCTYRKISTYEGNMRLLDNMRLIESEVLAPPTASTFERSITKLASYKQQFLENLYNSKLFMEVRSEAIAGRKPWKNS